MNTWYVVIQKDPSGGAERLTVPDDHLLVRRKRWASLLHPPSHRSNLLGLVLYIFVFRHDVSIDGGRSEKQDVLYILGKLGSLALCLPNEDD